MNPRNVLHGERNMIDGLVFVSKKALETVITTSALSYMHLPIKTNYATEKWRLLKCYVV
jgi:hypothetical protein